MGDRLQTCKPATKINSTWPSLRG